MYVFIPLVFVNGMKTEFYFIFFQVVNGSNIYWTIHIFPSDLKCHLCSHTEFQYIHGLFFFIFYFCSKDLFIYSCANITLYLLKLLYNMLWHLVGQNSPLCFFFFQAVLAILEHLLFCLNIRISLSNLIKILIRFWLELCWIYRFIGGIKMEKKY